MNARLRGCLRDSLWRGLGYECCLSSCGSVSTHGSKTRWFSERCVVVS